MHSLAFGQLSLFITADPEGGGDRKNMEMTQDVMANSLVYWVQDLYRGGCLAARARDLRDDVGGLDPRRAVVRCGVVGEGGARDATSASWRWSWRELKTGDHRSTRSAPA